MSGPIGIGNQPTIQPTTPSSPQQTPSSGTQQRTGQLSSTTSLRRTLPPTTQEIAQHNAVTLYKGFVGKRIKKEWEYEAEFHDADGREFAEFDIEKSRIEKVEADYTVKPKFRMRHDSLALHSSVRVYLDDVLVLEGQVMKAGRVWLRKDDVRNRPESVTVGQVCRVELGSGESFSAELKPD